MNQSTSIMNVVSLLTSTASLVLAVVAIYLSIVFYRMSSEASAATTRAAEGIGASVERLEKLFDKLYSDTFSMMRDTVSDMRRHIWPIDDQVQDGVTAGADKKEVERINELKSEMDAKVRDLLDRFDVADSRMGDLRDGMQRLMETAIANTRRVESEAKKEDVQNKIIGTLLRYFDGGPVPLIELAKVLRSDVPIREIMREVSHLHADGRIWLSSPSIEPDTMIRALEDGKTR